VFFHDNETISTYLDQAIHVLLGCSKINENKFIFFKLKTIYNLSKTNFLLLQFYGLQKLYSKIFSASWNIYKLTILKY